MEHDKKEKKLPMIIVFEFFLLYVFLRISASAKKSLESIIAPQKRD